MNQVKILLVDDHTILRKGLAALLNEEARFSVIAEAEDGRSAIEKTRTLNPDVVILDISMPSLNGLETARQLKKERPQTKILILTMHDSEEYIINALKLGVSGYLIKRDAPDELINAINAAMKNEIFLPPSVSTKLVNNLMQKDIKIGEKEERFASLTPREREILQLIAEGSTNREIAEKLFISPKTVKAHRSNLMEKLDVHNTAEITQYAIMKGLIHLDGL